MNTNQCFFLFPIYYSWLQRYHISCLTPQNRKTPKPHVSLIYLLLFARNMMQTGITPAPECAEEFNALRMKRTYRYLIFAANEDKTNFVITNKGEREKTFDDFKEDMPKDEPR